MNKNRLEAFSDGVFAIILTIMVLELKVPSASDPDAFQHLLNHFSSYLLSYAYVAIYWVNHHHLLHAAHQANGRVLWLNILLLFFLSLFPFCTAWVGDSHFAALPVFVYGLVLLAAALAYTALAFGLARMQGTDSVLAQAMAEDQDMKGKVSTGLYTLGVLAAFWKPHFAYGCYVLVAFIWIVPDTRIEKRLLEAKKKSTKRS